MASTAAPKATRSEQRCNGTVDRLHLVREQGDLLLAQVAQHIEQQIALGRLSPGDRLPSERELAAQLGLSRNTVTAAYLV